MVLGWTTSWGSHVILKRSNKEGEARWRPTVSSKVFRARCWRRWRRSPRPTSGWWASSSSCPRRRRARADLQTAAMDAARAIPMPSAPTETLEDLRRDPFAWYRRGFQAVAESTQRAAKLIETNAQIVARNAERLQSSRAASAKEIEQAASGYASRMKDIYPRA